MDKSVSTITLTEHGLSGGTCFFTTPSFDWARSFRMLTNPDDLDSADFELSDGSHVLLPSFILPIKDQAHLIQSAGLVVEQVSHTLVRDLQGHKLSPKLLLNHGHVAEVVTGYVATKH